MVFTAAQTTTFFENAAQMGLENRVRVYLQDEGINDVDDLEEFTTSESWKQIIENCKRPQGSLMRRGDCRSKLLFVSGRSLSSA